jgi:hypothetical protein
VRHAAPGDRLGRARSRAGTSCNAADAGGSAGAGSATARGCGRLRTIPSRSPKPLKAVPLVSPAGPPLAFRPLAGPHLLQFELVMLTELSPAPPWGDSPRLATQGWGTPRAGNSPGGKPHYAGGDVWDRHLAGCRGLHGEEAPLSGRPPPGRRRAADRGTSALTRRDCRGMKGTNGIPPADWRPIRDRQAMRPSVIPLPA